MKVVAMYLPQFHEVEENNQWWGKGFTEWHAVKRAEKLFNTHEQPKYPLNENYYDLLEKETMEWQADLMRKYGVDGICFYHYWFKDEKKILEKPAENLLQWSDIDIPFCFSWANESWVRTWAKLSGSNAWASKFEPIDADKEKSVLLQQDYGTEENWRRHFDYLLPFFRDSRYIKKDNAPVFMIYKPNDIMCLKKMHLKWDEWAREEGFNGIHLIGARCNQDSQNNVEADYLHEPLNTMTRMRGTISATEKPLKLDYDDVWNALLACEVQNDKTYLGAFTGYDDTPRHGMNGAVVYGGTAEKFKRYFAELLAKSAVYGSDIVFVNAWNEWGEGMYLEPDQKERYAYLEAVVYAKEHYQKYIPKYQMRKDLSIQGFWKRYDALFEEHKMVNRARIFSKWLWIKERGVSFEEYFKKKHIKSIAIYGLGSLGKHFYQELKDSSIEIKYVIDKRKTIKDIMLEIYDIEEAPFSVEAVVVALDYEYYNVVTLLRTRGFENIILLEEIVDTLYRNSNV